MKFPIKTAAIAAVVALGVGASSATAGSLITSAKIKNGTIQTVDLSASAKRALKGNAGPQGATGANGANGVQGPAGGFDPAKVSYVQGTPVSIAPGSTGNASATCPAGAKAISGGWLVISGNVGEVFGNKTYDGGGSWSLLIFNHSSYTNADVTPYAVCAAK